MDVNYNEKRIVCLSREYYKSSFDVSKCLFGEKILKLLKFFDLDDVNFGKDFRKINKRLRKVGYDIEKGWGVIKEFFEKLGISLEYVQFFNIINMGSIIEIEPISSFYEVEEDVINLKREIKRFIDKDNFNFLVKRGNLLFVPIVNYYTNDKRYKYEGCLVLKFKNTKLNKDSLLFILSLVFFGINEWVYETIFYYKNKLIFEGRLDELTRVFRRKFFMEKLKEYLKGEKDIVVFFLDIDYFKKINDKFGHNVGDVILNLFAAAILDSIKGGIDFVGRYGGEEFIVMLDGNVLKKLDVSSLIESIVIRIVNNFKFLIYNSNLPKEIKNSLPTFSGGVAVSNEVNIKDLDERAETLVGLADKRMYRGKNYGRNKVVLPDGSFITVFK